MAANAKVLIHIPAFVERFAGQRPRAQAKNRGLIDDHAVDIAEAEWFQDTGEPRELGRDR